MHLTCSRHRVAMRRGSAHPDQLAATSKTVVVKELAEEAPVNDSTGVVFTHAGITLSVVHAWALASTAQVVA